MSRRPSKPCSVIEKSGTMKMNGLSKLMECKMKEKIL